MRDAVEARRAVVTGTGLHVPGNPIPNSVFDARHGQDIDAFLRANRNIHQRYYMAADQATSDLILPAAREALAEAGLEAARLDLIIVATDTPDYISPSTAAVVQHRLGAINAGIFDVNTACAGFVTALDIAWKYLRADAQYRHILVVGAYGMSKFLDQDDYKIATLFADGAGAVVLSAVEQEGDGDDASIASGARGILASTLYGDGRYHDFMGIYSGGTRQPASHASIEAKDTLLRFAKRIPPETNVTHWPRLVRTVLARIEKQPADVAHYFFTQININSINETLDLLGVPRARAHNVMDKFAYTGSACIPMALADAADAHLLRPGDLIMLVGSGGGIAMAALALEWSSQT
ncbi:MAG: ketoacyl-ACP synthase III [Bacteroidota bacterium]|jgi:3-oxoacyl-[acyl-carrier-protein] synthase-3|nr:ketoacyl-ACP synthase III [Bacteroidota bacterium]